MPAEFELDPRLAGRLLAVAGVPGPVDAVRRLEGGISGSVFAVRIRHGCMTLTRTPRCATSFAAALDSPTMPALAAE